MSQTKRYFIADLVEEVGSLQAVAAQIVALTADPRCDLGKLSKVILSDNVMAMRFLALANSAALSRGQEIRNLRGSLARLGLERVRNVSLLMALHDMAPCGSSPANLDMTEFWKHSLATASCAQGLAWQRGAPAPDDAWLVGILHGIGIIAMSQKKGDDFQESLLRARALKTKLADAEITLFEFHHGEVGARILSQWQLPPLFCDAVEFHPEDFETGEVTPETAEMIRVLRDAVTVVQSVEYGDNGDGTDPLPQDEVAEVLGIPEEALAALVSKVDREVGEISRMLGLDLPAGQFREAFENSRRKAARLGLEGLDDALAREDLEEQLASARDIQQRLLPTALPDVPGFDIAAINQPSLTVSGDYYDFLTLPQDNPAFVIADVTGKGMPAALLASNLQASLRALGRVFPDLGELLTNVNNALFESTDPEYFATLFLARFDLESGYLSYASAGHNPPLLLRAGGEIEWLKPAGTPLGMFQDMVYPVIDVPLAPGDLLVTYTDGVTEATDRNDVEFTETGLEAAVRSTGATTCDEVITAILRAVDRHLAGGTGSRQAPAAPDAELPLAPNDLDAGDDLTMVVVRRIE